MEFVTYAMTVALGYLLGSIPFGYLAARAKGIDIRKQGSGNIGATNALRVLGKPAGITVLILDGLKGFAAASWLPILLAAAFPAASDHRVALGVLAGVCAVLGHNYTCWLKFKGGKGIATTAGVFAALAPAALLIALTVFGLGMWITGYVSMGSILAAITLPIAVWLTGGKPILVGVTAALGLLAILKHRTNIKRLLNGTENRIGSRGKKEVMP